MNQFLKKWYIWRSINQNLVSNVWLKKLLFFIQKLEIKVSVCPQLKLTSVYYHFFGFDTIYAFVNFKKCDSIFFGSDSEGGQIIW